MRLKIFSHYYKMLRATAVVLLLLAGSVLSQPWGDVGSSVNSPEPRQKMPKLVGETFVLKDLSRHNISGESVKILTVVSDHEKGTIIRTIPKGGALYGKSDTVSFFVSGGPGRPVQIAKAAPKPASEGLPVWSYAIFLLAQVLLLVVFYRLFRARSKRSPKKNKARPR